MLFRQSRLKLAVLLCAAGLATAAHASSNAAMDADVLRVNNAWAHIRYQVADRDQQYKQLVALEATAAQVAARYPHHAEPLLWQGIVVSEEAARANMLRQLSVATRARDILDQAYAIDAHVADGGAAMSLGVLYYKVPGFPLGFGSTKKARAYFEEALRLDPKGLDNNFFYGDFLASESDKVNARRILQRALLAPVSTERPVWDAGRRAEIRTLLAKLG
ncbi:hypothetical protein BH10PSE6_BH10PSE6_58880 [soil metagenome]